MDDDGSAQAAGRPKRQQVARACQRCASSKRKCTGTFPCERCMRLGVGDTCVEVALKRQLPKESSGARSGGAARRAGGASTILGAAVIDGYAWPYAGAEEAPAQPGKRRGDRLSRDAFVQAQRGHWPYGMSGDGGEEQESESGDSASGAESETSHSAMAAQFAHARIHDDGTPGGHATARRAAFMRGSKSARMADASSGDGAVVAAMDDGSIVRMKAPASGRTSSNEVETAMAANVDLLLRASGEAVTAEEKAAVAARAAALRAHADVSPSSTAYGTPLPPQLIPRTVIRAAPLSSPPWLALLLARGYSVDFTPPQALYGLHAEVDVLDPALKLLPLWQALFEDVNIALSFEHEQAPVPRHMYTNHMGSALFNIAPEHIPFCSIANLLWLFPPDIRPRAELASQLRLAGKSFYTWRGLYLRTNLSRQSDGSLRVYYAVFEAREHVFVSYYPRSFAVRAILSVFTDISAPILELSDHDIPVLNAYAMQLAAQAMDAPPAVQVFAPHGHAVSQASSAALSTHHDSFTEASGGAAGAFIGDDARYVAGSRFPSDAPVRMVPSVGVAGATVVVPGATSGGRLRGGSSDQSLHGVAAAFNGRHASSFSLPEGDPAHAAAAAQAQIAAAAYAAYANGAAGWVGSVSYAAAAHAVSMHAAASASPPSMIHAPIGQSLLSSAGHVQASPAVMAPASGFAMLRSPSEQAYLAAAYTHTAAGSPPSVISAPGFSPGAAMGPAYAAAAAAHGGSSGSLHRGSFGLGRLSGDFTPVGMPLDSSGLSSGGRRSSDVGGAFVPGVGFLGRTSLSEMDQTGMLPPHVSMPAGVGATSVPGFSTQPPFTVESHSAQEDRTISTSSTSALLPVTLGRPVPSTLPTAEVPRPVHEARALSSTSLDMPL